MNKLYTEVVNREMLDVIRRMASLSEYREPGIKNHLERVRSYCYLLARGLDLSPQDSEVISYASLLHDVGEICIPDSVLTKAGKLNSYEWELVRRHPIVGAEILQGSPSIVLQAAEQIALTHHERWDGSGYPYQLKGEDIPLSGRICALADIFDALTTRRPYKAEIPVNDAHQLVLDNRGVLFDPQLVQIFDANIEEIVKVLQTYP